MGDRVVVCSEEAFRPQARSTSLLPRVDSRFHPLLSAATTCSELRHLEWRVEVIQGLEGMRTDARSHSVDHRALRQALPSSPICLDKVSLLIHLLQRTDKPAILSTFHRMLHNPHLLGSEVSTQHHRKTSPRLATYSPLEGRLSLLLLLLAISLALLHHKISLRVACSVSANLLHNQLNRQSRRSILVLQLLQLRKTNQQITPSRSLRVPHHHQLLGCLALHQRLNPLRATYLQAPNPQALDLTLALHQRPRHLQRICLEPLNRRSRHHRKRHLQRTCLELLNRPNRYHLRNQQRICLEPPNPRSRLHLPDLLPNNRPLQPISSPI